MNKLKIITLELTKLGFEVAMTTYEALIQNSDLEYLSTLEELPDCDPSKLLKSFPDLFVVHKNTPPQKGIFFITIIDKLNEEAKTIYENYFPGQIVIADVNKKGDIYAKWLHKNDKFLPLTSFLKQISE